MKCLSIKQPWAWLIVNGFKDVENRTRRTHYRGRVLIHTGERRDLNQFGPAGNIYWRQTGLRLPWYDEFRHGGIVGIAEIVDCVTASDSPWFEGPFGYVLANARPLPFMPYRGRLGLFNVPDEIVKRLGVTL